jgi:ribosomal protein S13
MKTKLSNLSQVNKNDNLFMVQIFGQLLKINHYIFRDIKTIYGINKFQAHLLCSKLSIGLDCRINDLSQKYVVLLLKEIERSNLDIETMLKQNKKLSIKRLVEIKSNRGMQHLIKNFKRSII